jgi:hypothetical protein
MNQGHSCIDGLLMEAQRLQAKDLEDWEQRRVKRLPGEPDGTLV